ncbi:glycosyltransferase family 4 protein [Scrofimicrobium sp. R131]|uniref:Glycosyltransferase family 4 protein n=1 Tax=Scrofimicrobium appendicitidis TaxID=3079930 RepID=A0AAU7V5T2_9ACTO
MKIGIVCPYSFDVPGGVQFHIRDLTEELIRRGHLVSVLAPSEDPNPPAWLASTGGAMAIKFNGSVARLAFGPVVACRTRKWLEEGQFDVIHIHEPETPSLGLLALMNADVPVVATFHAALDRSVVRQLTSGVLAPFLEKISARIAVSQEARRTLIEHHAGDAVIIPNGVYTASFREAEPDPRWVGTDERPVIVFLGRLDEPRKGLPVFAGAIEPVLAEFPGARFLVAGRGTADVLPKLPAVEVLGEITDAEKESLLKGATIYVAPQLGGESFGIVLVEAMAAGTTVVASDIAAFSAVLEEGEAGILFPTGSSEGLADALLARLRSADDRVARAGQRAAEKYDWSTVTEKILAVYQAVLPPSTQPQTGTAYELINERLGRAER